MKKWLYLTAAVAAVAVLARLPHPARDVAKLAPVRSIYLYIENGAFCIETDTDDSGSGNSLSQASEDLKANAHAEIFLDTAEYLFIAPDLPIPAELYELLRPDTKIIYTGIKPDLKQTANLTTSGTLAELRAEQASIRKG